jgi:hypothetical protein
MLACLRVTETVPQCLLALGHGWEETMMGRTSPEPLPASLDHWAAGRAPAAARPHALL